MKIKRLEIIGFKSFVDKVSLEFPEGVTAVVGPNGCGKSNIVDAIRWVMGEQSAKNLRGRQMEDIIFGGSESRKPLGMAEVSLVFSTDDGRVPAKYLNYSEIQVTRRLYRDGESEYYLNKTPCRLLDISELFMDTGVGARAYSIIEQGRIGMILLAKPEERRFLIEEAAGVTKYKARKQVALKKIEGTRQNLVRIADIISEIRRQLNSLQRQAKKAEKFRTYREELKRIELSLAVRENAKLESNRHCLGAEVAALEDRSSQLAAELEAGELKLEERRVVLLEEERGVTLAQEEIYRIKGEYQGAESREEFRKKELLNLDRHAARFTDELAALERQLQEGEAELRLLEMRRGEFLTESVDEEQNLAVRERELEEMTAVERSIAAVLDEKRRDLFALLAEVAKYNNQHSGAARRLEAMAERFERNRRETELLKERSAETAGRVQELETTLATQVQLKARLAEEVAAGRSREALLREELLKAEHELQSRRDELSRKGSRLHSLQELEAQFAGYGQGVRTILTADNFRGRFGGIAADLLETGEEYEAAVEAALGERLQGVVGGEDQDVLTAIGFLRDSSGGRCTFLLPISATAATPTLPEGLVSLAERVTVGEKCRHLLEPLLGVTCLAEDLQRALQLSRRYPELAFVTKEGDLAQAGGVVSGGSAEGTGSGLIHKKREIKLLSREVDDLAVVVREQEENRTRLKEGIVASEEMLRDLRSRQHQADMQLLNHEKDLQRAREELQRGEERLAVTALELAQLSEERQALEQEMSASGTSRQEAEGRQRRLEAEVEELNAVLSEKRQEIDAARELVTSLKVRVAALREKKDSTLRACKRVEDLVADLKVRIGSHRVELEKSALEREKLVAGIAEGEGVLRELVLKEREAEGRSASLRERYEAVAAAVREEEGRIKSVRGQVEQVRQESGEKNYRLSELTLQLRHLHATIADKYRVDFATLLAQHEETEDSEEGQAERLHELQRQVDELGEVNLTAIDEYRELEERFTFLTDQKNDLEESLSSLQQAIQRINRTTRKRFLETFQQVNVRFQEIFPRLFCGGRAELRLTEPENLLESGIEIIVQPPGKKLQNVTLLSGGEKALTAVALIFSIFLIKPSPFCLLDEVDAPLDDANIGRFNDMIREMTSFSQFILITHSKTTMAVADTLYGVTMEEPGVSKLVSVRLN